MIQKSFPFILLLAVALASARAAEPAGKPGTSLGEAIAAALRNNPELRVFEAQIAGAKGGVTTARTWENPELSVAPGFKVVREGGRHETLFHGDFEVSQTFKFPGKRALEIAIAQRNVELQQLALEGFRFQLSARVRKAFYQMLAAQQVIGLRTEQVESATVFVASARKRAESGYASDFETLKSQADLIAATKALQQARGEVITARVTLNALMARPPSAPLEISGALENLAPPGTARDYVALALARNPSLRAQFRAGDLAGLNLSAAKLSRKPDWKAGPSLEYTDVEQTVGLGFSLPLPLWDQKKGEIARATAEQQKALAEIDRARAVIAGEVTIAAAGLQVAKDSAALYTPDLLRQLRAFVVQAEQGYTQSSTTLIIFLDAKRTYFDTLSDYYEALAKIAASRAELESAIGVPLDTNKP
ncbi:MAG: outer membrane protein heavy metal efflux system [Chthoniobacter sp.]|jgi:cobalt-zinc-cadmium efflux system outer membrane protein|nr:outer membrane protein heavy metal efflux system [Chthoniobacter sp.]